MNTHSDDSGVLRQDHYGAGRQPWDDILAMEWGPEFAAGNVLKYLRRTKEPEHSLESARWYWARLAELVERKAMGAPWVLFRLTELLTDDEKRKLEGSA